MKYNNRYEIFVYISAGDCNIFDNVECKTVGSKTFPSEKEARSYLRNVLKQRPTKEKVK